MALILLNNLPKIYSKRKRVGRGYASGTGKTCGIGHKGQKSRSGKSVMKLYRYTGQNTLYRSIPKRGFRSRKKLLGIKVIILSIQQLNNLVESNNSLAIIRKIDLVKAGLLNDLSLPVKLLGNGDCKSSITVEVDYFSKGAEKKIIGQGGKIITIDSVKNLSNI